MIEIRGIDTHAGAGFAAGPIGDAGGEADFFEFFSFAVGEKEVGGGVVGDEEIEEAVVVDVGGDGAPGFAGIIGDAHFLADVGEGAVAVVVEEPAGHRVEDAGVAVFVDAC